MAAAPSSVQVDISQHVNKDETEHILASFAPRHREEVSWEVQQAFYTMSDAHKRPIFTRSWFSRKADKPRALVFLLHGVNEHISRYVGLAHHLTANGFGVIGHDHVGHGASAGTLGDIEDFELLVSDAKQIIRTQSANYPGVPVFIFGHSMGSMMAFHASYELEQESPGFLKGVIFSGFSGVPGPGAASPFGLTCLFCLTKNECVANSIGGFMAWLAPQGDLAPVIRSQLTHDEAELTFLDTDPYHNRGQIQNRTGYQVLQATKKYRARVAEYTLPFLALHGSADTLTYAVGSQQLFDHAGSSDKAVKFYLDLYHEILLETSKDVVYEDVLEFLTQRLAGQPAA